MIIGISGKKQAGKDTIGEIIQYLIYNEERKDNVGFYYPVDVWLEERNEGKLKQYPLKANNHFEVKKFADKLKQMASLMLGIPVEDFEKEEVKNRVLGEEWTRWYYIGGYAGNIFYKKKMTPYFYSEEEAYGYKVSNEAFSLSLQEGELIKEIPTVRQFLQELGTEAIRNTIHVNAWVNALMCDYKKCFDSNIKFVKSDGTSMELNYPNWIITDVRFPNELAVVDGKGFSIRVNRPPILQEHDVVMYKDKKATLVHIYNNSAGVIEQDSTTTTVHLKDLIKITKDEHPSETALDDAKFDYTIENNGTIDELIEKVKEILIKEKII